VTAWFQSPLAALVYPLALLVVLWSVDRVLSLVQRRQGARTQVDWRWVRPVAMTVLTLAGLVLWSATLRGTVRAEYLKLLTALLAGAVALAATSPIGSALAGLMMRTQRQFRAGDWIENDSLVGRVTERGIFFVEVQDEQSNLIAVPNTWLATRPVSVIRCPPTRRSPYTLLDAEITLGYDVPRRMVERLLAEAARSCSLHEPWVEIGELGDFAVRYRVRGRTSETQSLLRLRSALRAAILDTLHAAGVEIVSPTFMNQRLLGEQARTIPSVDAGPEPDLATDPDRDSFERANVGSELSGLLATIDWFGKRIKRLEAVSSRAGETDRERLERRIASLRQELEQAESRQRSISESAEAKRRR